MSRIGRKSIPLPKGVTVTVSGLHLTVKGPKGTLERDLHPLVTVKVGADGVDVARVNEERLAKSMHGMTRTLIANMVHGVVTPFSKTLEINGVGYRAELKGSNLDLQLGLSHDVHHPIPKTVTCVVDKQTTVILTSPDKELLGQVAAEIRAYRKSEPYKGKGIKYQGERVRRKEGKTGA
jgi:large subunit ribosomal protein L6